LATVSIQVSLLASVFRPVLSANRQESGEALPLAKPSVVRTVSLQADLVERASFQQPLHLGEAPGATLAFGEPTRGFSKFGGGFCPNRSRRAGRDGRSGSGRRCGNLSLLTIFGFHKSVVLIDLSARDFDQQWSF